MVTPLTTTLRWVETYLDELSHGADEISARLSADRITEVSGKSFARLFLPDTILTIPVEGGAAILKRRNACPILSEHGKWRREHLGAIRTIYGRTPYFIHLMPRLEEIYDNSQGISLEEFNSRLLDLVLSMIDRDALTMRMTVDSSRLIRQEKRLLIDPDLSILDALFHMGKEVTLAL